MLRRGHPSSTLRCLKLKVLSFDQQVELLLFWLVIRRFVHAVHRCFCLLCPVETQTDKPVSPPYFLPFARFLQVEKLLHVIHGTSEAIREFVGIFIR